MTHLLMTQLITFLKKTFMIKKSRMNSFIKFEKSSFPTNEIVEFDLSISFYNFRCKMVLAVWIAILFQVKMKWNTACQHFAGHRVHRPEMQEIVILRALGLPRFLQGRVFLTLKASSSLPGSILTACLYFC